MPCISQKQKLRNTKTEMSDLAFVEEKELGYRLRYLPDLVDEMQSSHFSGVPSLTKAGSTNGLTEDFMLEDFQVIFADLEAIFKKKKNLGHCLSNLKV